MPSAGRARDVQRGTRHGSRGKRPVVSRCSASQDRARSATSSLSVQMGALTSLSCPRRFRDKLILSPDDHRRGSVSEGRVSSRSDGNLITELPTCSSLPLWLPGNKPLKIFLQVNCAIFMEYHWVEATRLSQGKEYLAFQRNKHFQKVFSKF